MHFHYRSVKVIVTQMEIVTLIWYVESVTTLKKCQDVLATENQARIIAVVL